MRRWDERPFEIRNLFNPAFCGLIVFRAIEAYEKIDSRGMPFSISLLVLPISLHKDSRDLIGRYRKYLIRIIEENPQLRVGFAERTSAMLPFTFEGVGLLMHSGAIVVEEGRFKLGTKRVRKSSTGTEETKSCERIARFVGREFAQISDRVTIYTTLGIRP